MSVGVVSSVAYSNPRFHRPEESVIYTFGK